MRGIDIYHGDASSGTTLKPVPEKAYKESDFVIIKATQGVSYKYTSFFTAMAKKAVKDGKLIGAYHYAAGNDAVKEADYFISIVKPYIGQAVLALDWERGQNKAWGSKTWAKAFIDRVREKSGVNCMIYVNDEGLKQVANLCGKVPLWFAGFPTDANSWTVPKFKYNLGLWKEYAIWQFTSSGEKVDRNTTALTASQWHTMASAARPGVDRLITLLGIYHAYILAHSKYFINKYESSLVSFNMARAKVDAKKTVGITCVVPLRWALYEMGIAGANGKSLISAPGGSFLSYYTGDIKACFSRTTKGGPVGKTVKQAIDGKLLKAGDIICFQKLTHTAVYSGSGYVFYEGGGSCVKDSHYPNGIKLDYSKGFYADKKIAEILRIRAEEKANVPKTGVVKKTADIILAQARSWIGFRESDGSHKKIIDLYNAYKPLARGYKVKYTDSWCAAFVSACFIANGYMGLIPIECSCEKMIELAKKKGIWVENENRTPAPGELILYDWQDSGKGDNTGLSDHIGIVEKVSGGAITVIEGNYSNAVGRRTIKVNGKGIRGYICPKYDKLQTTTPKSEPKKEKQGYAGKFPSLPPRGYYKHGDGFRQYAKYAPQIEKLQKLINWITGGKLTVDGQYGSKTEAEVKKAQGILGIKKDGLFGADTLAKARNYTR